MASQSLRFKLYSLISLPIVALIALWTFVTGHILGDFFDLRRASTVYEHMAVPSAELVREMQTERRVSAIYLSSAPPEREPLNTARQNTDRVAETFLATVNSDMAATVTTPEIREDIDGITLELGKLAGLRERVDGGGINRLDAVLAYGKITDAVFGLYDKLPTVAEVGLFQQAIGLRNVVHSRDLLSRVDALVAGATMAGRMTGDEHETIEELVPNRKLLMSDGMTTLDGELRAPYGRMLSSVDYKNLVALEHEIVEERGLPRDREKWAAVAGRIGATLDQLLVSRSEVLNTRAEASAGGIIATIVVVGGLGLVAILVAVIWSARLGRGLAEELAGLRVAATDLADVRLPSVVERLRQGERVDVEVEAPPIATEDATQEVRDLGQAFSSVQRTAVRAAVGQAELRQGLNRVFRNLARRNQTLVHRQLGHLNAMQRRTAEPEALDDLFKLDHLTTRMRRQAEGLIILSGAPAGRSWPQPVPMLSVVRGAVAEVESYQRVDILPIPEATLSGKAAADVIHLLAELVENATGFSPPNTPVTVGGEVVGRGFVVEIEDRGLGLTDSELAELNQRLAHPPEFDLADSDRLGLFVVGRLAVRHGIKVTLRRSPYGGTTAVVLIPLTLMTSDLAHTSTD
ncbi:nitrate- and nitrite sensing domain-containing protein [Nonomuraea sp. NPDC046570]|uniref:sensor histidine kinase n=1 Tax=Nonomuraea sp. NPDC046570 TaxID=3155255 RepID=UPI003410B701